MIVFITCSSLRLLPILYMLFIWLQSSNFNPSKLEYLSDEFSSTVYLLIGGSLEMAHLLEFGILYFLLIVAFLTFGRLSSWKELAALVISISYAFTDEIHQYFVPYRSFSVIDMVKNTIGIWVMWYIVHRKYYKHKQSKFGSFLRGITTNLRRNNSNINV
jgi:VanZ family protein